MDRMVEVGLIYALTLIPTAWEISRNEDVTRSNRELSTIYRKDVTRASCGHVNHFVKSWAGPSRKHFCFFVACICGDINTTWYLSFSCVFWWYPQARRVQYGSAGNRETPRGLTLENFLMHAPLNSSTKNRLPKVRQRANAMVGFAGGCTHVMDGGSRVTMDPHIPTVPGRSTSDFHRPGRHCLHQARSAVRCSASRMKSGLHPTKNSL